MSGPRRRVLSHTITTKTLNGITFSLIAVVTICTLLTFSHAPATAIVSDDFNDNSIDTATWIPTTCLLAPRTRMWPSLKLRNV